MVILSPRPGSFPTFTFRADKAAEAIERIARAQPGITQYFIGKILYLADKAHFLDFGRPITFDRYVAMVHGPVPSAIRNMLAAAAGADAGMDRDRRLTALEHADELLKHVRVELEVRMNGERQHVFPLEQPNSSLPDCDPVAASGVASRHLSGSDIECLDEAIALHGEMSFASIRHKTHQDEAWHEAWFQRANGRVADIDIALWAEPGDREGFRRQLTDYGAYMHR